MAALIPDARAARAEAERLRRESAMLKVAARASASHSREQLRSAESAVDRSRRRWDEPLPSPWSTLHWSSDHDALAAVLVPGR